MTHIHAEAAAHADFKILQPRNTKEGLNSVLSRSTSQIND